MLIAPPGPCTHGPRDHLRDQLRSGSSSAQNGGARLRSRRPGPWMQPRREQRWRECARRRRRDEIATTTAASSGRRTLDLRDSPPRSTDSRRSCARHPRTRSRWCASAATVGDREIAGRGAHPSRIDLPALICRVARRPVALAIIAGVVVLVIGAGFELCGRSMAVSHSRQHRGSW
jgi:hypothetical protein